MIHGSLIIVFVICDCGVKQGLEGLHIGVGVWVMMVVIVIMVGWRGRMRKWVWVVGVWMMMVMMVCLMVVQASGGRGLGDDLRVDGLKVRDWYWMRARVET